MIDETLTQRLPHRPPALLLERVVEQRDDMIRTVMHFPEEGSPLLLVEAAAQSVAVLFGGPEAAAGKPPAEGFLVGVRDFAWKATPVAGEIILAVRPQRSLAPFYIFEACARQNGIVVAEGLLTLFKKEDQDHAAEI